MTSNNATKRNNLTVTGSGRQTIILAHGFGCDQTMWRFLVPHLRDCFRLIAFDYVGCGQSDPNAFSVSRYSNLDGYAQDIIDVCQAADVSDAILIGHSVSSMIGLIASTKVPERISKLIMICPSPYFLNDPPEYHGGFEQTDLEELIGLMDSNYIGWANNLAPLVVGLDGDALADELAHSFCSTDPLFAKTFAKATFFSDCRSLLKHSNCPTLILQSSDDALADVSVGRFVQSQIPHAKMHIISANGHCLHMTHADEIAPVIKEFILH